MALKFFTVPIQQSQAAEEEVNAFLRSHRVLAVDRRWVEQGAASFWCLCVDYLDGAGSDSSARQGQAGRAKVDYKEVLKPDEFAVFARLRELRKEMAQSDAVPVYTIFTNEQLAKMVQSRANTRADLEKITGVGDARLDKYGQRVLELLAQAWSNSHEASGQPL